MKTNKKVIQRNLPLDQKYLLIGVSYLSVENGGGHSCDNCGKLITNIANIQNDHKKNYYIGLDCLDSILENNNLLEHESYARYIFSDKPAIAKAKSLRAKILNATKKDSTFKATMYAPEGKDYFGFSYTCLKTKTWVYDREAKDFKDVEPYLEEDRLGFDYRFDVKYKELTLNYIKGLPNVILE
jgi:hypothetical protein